MRDANRSREEAAAALRPIGAAFAAVVAGLGASAPAHAADRLAPPAPPTPQERSHHVDPTADPDYGAEDVLVLSEAMEVFGDEPAPLAARQGDLFDR